MTWAQGRWRGEVERREVGQTRLAQRIIELKDGVGGEMGVRGQGLLREFLL